MNKFVTINAIDLRKGDMIVLGRPGVYYRVSEIEYYGGTLFFEIEDRKYPFMRENTEQVNILPRHLLKAMVLK